MKLKCQHVAKVAFERSSDKDGGRIVPKYGSNQEKLASFLLGTMLTVTVVLGPLFVSVVWWPAEPH